jgi:putative membrane protein
MRLRRLAWGCVAGYGALTVMSILAFALMVGKPVPAGMDAGLWAAGFAFGMKYMGATIIVLGFGAAVLGLAAAVGAPRGLAGAAAVVAVTLVVELIGARTGWPFGQHGYGSELGYKVLGLIPFVIPLSWFLMLYASLGIALRFGRGSAVTLVLAALGLFAWDVLMEPAMSAAYPFWVWRSSGVYYGMPLANWMSWLVIGPVIAALLRRIGGSGLGALSRDPLPVTLYALTGLMPFALAVQYRLYAAAAVGGGAMLAFLAAPFLPRVGVSRAAASTRRVPLPR